MSNDDPFTLDLFNTTTLSSGLGLGVTAFGSGFGTTDPDSEQTSSPASQVAAPVSQLVTARPSDNMAVPRGDNFHLETIVTSPRVGSSAPATTSMPSSSLPKWRAPIGRRRARNRRG
jgi:hypothetical protein